MKTLHKRCAGLDVHKKEVVACLRVVARSKATYEVRRFPTTTRDLIALAEWLEAAQCTHVAMEATGVYWKPVWHILEGRFQLILANAAHITRAQERRQRRDLDRRPAGARPDPGELRAATADPGVA